MNENNNYNKLKANQILNNSIILKIIKNANNIAKLVSLNNYIDKIKFELWQNFILRQNLENQVKVKINAKFFLDNHDLLNKVKVTIKLF